MTACKTIRVLAHYPPHPEIGLPLHTPVDKQTSVPRALGKNLFRQWASLWTFLKHEQIELTNNPAERVIRSTVLIRKTNGNTASELGKTFVANLQSVLATAHYQNIDALVWLEAAFAAQLSGEPATMLLPPPPG